MRKGYSGIAIDFEYIDLLEALSRIEGRKKKRIVQELIDEYINKHEKNAEIMETFRFLQKTRKEWLE